MIEVRRAVPVTKRYEVVAVFNILEQLQIGTSFHATYGLHVRVEYIQELFSALLRKVHVYNPDQHPAIILFRYSSKLMLTKLSYASPSNSEALPL